MCVCIYILCNVFLFATYLSTSPLSNTRNAHCSCIKKYNMNTRKNERTRREKNFLMKTKKMKKKTPSGDSKTEGNQ